VEDDTIPRLLFLFFNHESRVIKNQVTSSMNFLLGPVAFQEDQICRIIQNQIPLSLPSHEG